MNSRSSEDRPVVLLVEDEALVRMDAADCLGEAGYHVLEAANADVALTVLEVWAQEVCLLFTDIDMPGSMNGLALAHEVQRHWPHIRLLISSGHMTPEPDQLPAQGRFVPKPYRVAEVIQFLQGPAQHSPSQA